MKKCLGSRELGGQLETIKSFSSIPLPLCSPVPSQQDLSRLWDSATLLDGPCSDGLKELARPAPARHLAPGLCPQLLRGLVGLLHALLPSLQLLFLTGLSFIIGLRKTFQFFFQRHKLKGTSFFLGGVVVVLLRWPLLGMFLETYGFFSLFKGFFPVAFGFLGNVCNIPFLGAVSR
uniref:Golgi transport 1A n=1 Tax=Macaca mulatta TaxID=9544 RepID=A0A5F7ZF31_MACMU